MKHLKAKDKIRFSPLTATLIVIIALAVVLILVQLPHNPVSSIATTTVSSTAHPSTVDNYISSLKNVTYEYLYLPGKKSQETPVRIIGIDNISTNTSNPNPAQGKLFAIHILYGGYFGFDSGEYNSSAFLGNTIDLYYFGYKSPGARNLLVFDNVRNVTEYFNLKNSSMSVPAGKNPSDYLEETVYLYPTANATGKAWKFCGGLFVAYLNNTNAGGIFSKLSFNRTNIYNSSILNFVSDNCTTIDVA